MPGVKGSPKNEDPGYILLRLHPGRSNLLKYLADREQQSRRIDHRRLSDLARLVL